MLNQIKAFEEVEVVEWIPNDGVPYKQTKPTNSNI